MKDIENDNFYISLTFFIHECHECLIDMFVCTGKIRYRYSTAHDNDINIIKFLFLYFFIYIWWRFMEENEFCSVWKSFKNIYKVGKLVLLFF